MGSWSLQLACLAALACCVLLPTALAGPTVKVHIFIPPGSSGTLTEKTFTASGRVALDLHAGYMNSPSMKTMRPAAAFKALAAAIASARPTVRVVGATAMSRRKPQGIMVALDIPVASVKASGSGVVFTLGGKPRVATGPPFKRSLSLRSDSVYFSMPVDCDLVTPMLPGACFMAGANATKPGVTIWTGASAQVDKKAGGALKVKLSSVVPIFHKGTIHGDRASQLVMRRERGVRKDNPEVVLTAMGKAKPVYSNLKMTDVKLNKDGSVHVTFRPSAKQQGIAASANAALAPQQVTNCLAAADCSAANMYQACELDLNCASFPYLGATYNIIAGFPSDWKNGVDPGYLETNYVFDATSINANNGLTSVATGCSSTYSTSQWASSQDVQSTNSYSLGASGEYDGAKFSGNAKYSSINNNMVNNNQASTLATVTCQMLGGNIQNLCSAGEIAQSVTLDTEFLNAVDTLMVYMGASNWNNFYEYLATSFISSYGTHAITAISLGGQSSAIYTATASSFATLQSSTFSWGVSGAYGPAQATLGGSTSVSNAQQMAELTTTSDTTTAPFVANMYSSTGINAQVWTDGLSSMEVSSLAPLSAGTETLSWVFSNCAGYLWTDTSYSQSQLNQLAGLIDAFINSCLSNEYYNSTAYNCNQATETCLPGYAPVASVAPGQPACQMCLAYGQNPNGCTVGQTAQCGFAQGGTSVCLCNSGKGGSTCSSVCTMGGSCACDASWTGSFDVTEDNCPNTYFTSTVTYESDGCSCKCCMNGGPCGPGDGPPASDALACQSNTVQGYTGMPPMPTGSYNEPSSCGGCSLQPSLTPIPGVDVTMTSGVCYALTCEWCANDVGTRNTPQPLDLCTCPQSFQNGYIGNNNGVLYCGNTPS